MLILYVLFLASEHLLFTSNSYNPEVPWASFDQFLPTLRVILKTVLSAG